MIYKFGNKLWKKNTNLIKHFYHFITILLNFFRVNYFWYSIILVQCNHIWLSIYGYGFELISKYVSKVDYNGMNPNLRQPPASAIKQLRVTHPQDIIIIVVYT